MSATFDTLRAASDMESAGMDRKAAEAVAEAIHAGHRERATRSDVEALRWVVGIDVAIGLATLAGVLAMAFR